MEEEKSGFKVIKENDHMLVCDELCGYGFPPMRMTKEEFERWRL